MQHPSDRYGLPDWLYGERERPRGRPAEPESLERPAPPAVSLEETAAPRRQRPAPQPPPAPARRPPTPRHAVRGLLGSRDGLRLAVVLQAVLGPPRALAPWEEPGATL